jgi:hypothetical protein
VSEGKPAKLDNIQLSSCLHRASAEFHYLLTNYEPKHVGAGDRFLTVLIFCDFNCVRHSWLINSEIFS